MDLSFLGPAGASVVIVLLFLNFLNKQEDKRRKNDKVVAETLAKEGRKSSKELSGLIKRLDSYIRGHNGRQSEIHVETMKAFKTIYDKFEAMVVKDDDRDVALREYINKINSQEVAEQRVKHQIVEEKD